MSAAQAQFQDRAQGSAGLELLQGSGQFFAALEQAFDAAREQIMLETYMFDFTRSGQNVGQALVRAAARGVRVQLVVDGVGTGRLPLEWRERFDAAGVQWQVYSPLGVLGLLLPSRWRRLHRKLCVVDAGTPSAVAFCGGINVLDDFYDPNHGELTAPRFDFAVHMQGPASSAMREVMADVMAQFWWRTEAAQALQQGEFKGAYSSVRKAGTRLVSNPLRNKGATQLIAREDHSTLARMVFRDNFRNRKQIELAYRKAIGEARQSIIIANAYFLPGGKLRRALVHAARRGVRVQLLLQGKYEYFMQYHASRPVFHALLEAGIEIYEYAPSFLHAKVAVIDAQGPRPWATVGSSNLDPLSLLLAREANVLVFDRGFAQDLHARLSAAMQSSGQRMDRAVFAQRPLSERALDWLAFGLMRAALWLVGKRY